MAQQTINVGAAPNDGTGDPDRTAWTKANANFSELYASGTSSSTPPQGRLTLTTGTPVLSGSATSATVFWTPYVGNLCPLYNGTAFVMTPFTEISQAITDTTKSPAATVALGAYDMFVWSDSGTICCTRGPAWTGAATRGTGAGTTELVRVNGIWLNAVNITNGPATQRGTYVGTIKTNGANSGVPINFGGIVAGGSAAQIFVWNAYNRVPWSAMTAENADSWSYASAAWRTANGAGNMFCAWIDGLNEGIIHAIHNAVAFTSSAGARTGIGFDSSTAPATLCTLGSITGALGNAPAILVQSAGLGYHFAYALEYGGTGVTFYGDAGVPGILQSGMHVVGQY